MPKPGRFARPIGRRPPFDIELDLRGVVRPCGDLDRGTAPQAVAVIQALRAARAGDLTIDLADVHDVCADALDAIVAIAVAQHGINRELYLINANHAVQRELFASGMTNLIWPAKASRRRATWWPWDNDAAASAPPPGPVTTR